MPFDDDGEDLGELLRRLQRRTDSIFGRFRIRPEDAEDLLQNVMMQFVMKESQIRNPPAWICRSLELECLMHLRTERRRIVRIVEDALIEVLAGGSMPDAERELMRRRLGRWISKLPWKCQNLIRLKFGEERDADEIAKLTGYKKSSVDKVIRRCIQALKKKIDAALRRIIKPGKRDDP